MVKIIQATSCKELEKTYNKWEESVKHEYALEDRQLIVCNEVYSLAVFYSLKTYDI